MEGKKYIFVKIVLVIGMIVWSIFIIGMPYSYYLQANEAVYLANNGVSSIATILEYKHGTGGRDGQDFYLISYDNYKGLIKMRNHAYDTNDKLSVIYDKNNPKLVKVGYSGISAWELFKLNTFLVLESIVWILWFTGLIIGIFVWVKVIPFLFE